MQNRGDKMLRKIKSAYKLQAAILLGIGIGSIIIVIPELYSYLKYKNASVDEMWSIETKELFTLFYLAIIISAFIKMYYKFFMAVGVSRKSIFISNILAYISVAPIITIPNLIIYKAFHNYSKFESIYLSIFNKRYENSAISENTVILEYFLWQITTFLVVALFVYSIMLLLYRLSKKGKIIFISLLITIPTIASISMGVTYYATKSPIIAKLLDIIIYLAGDGQYPMRACVTNIVVAILFGTISYLFIRRSAVK